MTPFSLVLQSTETPLIQAAVRAGADAVLVNWEANRRSRGGALPEGGVHPDDLADLRRVRGATKARVICRLNPFSEATKAEVEAAIAGGADEILLPQARSPNEVDETIRLAGGRRPVGIVIERMEAVEAVHHFARRPLARVRVGLTDLSAERGDPNPFTPIVDGTLDRIRRPFGAPFGFSELTSPDRESPVPTRLLMAEMTRLSCSHAFLPRSFHEGTAGREVSKEIAGIRRAMQDTAVMGVGEILRACDKFAAAVAAWKPASTAPVVTR
jgi:hypothetical protein